MIVAARELVDAFRELGRALWAAVEPTMRRIVCWISRLDGSGS